MRCARVRGHSSRQRPIAGRPALDRAPRVLPSPTSCAPRPDRSSRPVRLLGVSAFYHDSAAALIEDGRIVAAAQEERFTRKKHDAGFPYEAIRYCLSAGKVDLRRRRQRRLLRKAAGQVRAAARDLSRQRTAGLWLLPHGDARLDQGKAFSEARAGEGAERDRRRRQDATASCSLPSITRATPPPPSFPRRSRRPSC